MRLESIFFPDSGYSFVVVCFPIFVADIGGYFEYSPCDFFLADFEYQLVFLAFFPYLFTAVDDGAAYFQVPTGLPFCAELLFHYVPYARFALRRAYLFLSLLLLRR